MFAVIKKVFFNETEISENQLRISRLGFIIDAMASIVLTTLVNGVYVAGMFSFLGASEALSGVLLSTVALAGFFQFFAPIIGERLTRRKLFVVSCNFISRLSMSLVLFMPYLIHDKSIALGFSAFFFVCGYLLHNLYTPLYSIWMTDLLPGHMRGRYFGVKDSLTFCIAAVFSYLGGYILDYYEKIGSDAFGFFLIAIILLVMACIEAASLLPIREPVLMRKKTKVSLLDIIKKTLESKSFRPTLVINILYQTSWQIGAAFISIYRLSRLGLSYEFISLISAVDIICRVAFAPLWGRIAGKYGWYTATKFSYSFIMASVVILGFTTAGNAYPMSWLSTIFSAVGWAGMGLSVFGMQFAHAPAECSSLYISCNGALSATIGFIASLIGSGFIAVANGFSIDIGTFAVCDMQLLFFVQGLLGVIFYLYITAIERKEKHSATVKPES